KSRDARFFNPANPVNPVYLLMKLLRNYFVSGKTDRALRGAHGEKLAARFLRKHGYKILYRNFRGRNGGELDLVCRHGDTLVFVEVKTRSSEDFGRPIETLRRDQRQRIARGALTWLRMLDDPDILFRFDVVEVLLPQNSE